MTVVPRGYVTYKLYRACSNIFSCGSSNVIVFASDGRGVGAITSSPGVLVTIGGYPAGTLALPWKLFFFFVDFGVVGVSGVVGRLRFSLRV